MLIDGMRWVGWNGMGGWMLSMDKGKSGVDNMLCYAHVNLYIYILSTLGNNQVKQPMDPARCIWTQHANKSHIKKKKGYQQPISNSVRPDPPYFPRTTIFPWEFPLGFPMLSLTLPPASLCCAGSLSVCLSCLIFFDLHFPFPFSLFPFPFSRFPFP